jgi:hypothetical protein
LNVDPLTAPLICPSQLTVVEFQLPLTSDPDCVRTIVNWTVALLDDPIVPFHVPAMLAAVTPFSPDGPVEFSAHAETLATTQTISARRMTSPLFDVEVINGERMIVARGANVRQCPKARLAHQM